MNSKTGTVFLLASLLSITADSVCAQETSREEINETLDLFATLDRISGGEDERTANAYLRRKLSEYGVAFDSYDIELFLSRPIDAGVQVLGPDSRVFDAINHAFSRSTPVEGVEGELIYIGRNMTADPFDAPLIDYEEIDVRGKIVLDDGYPAPYRAWATEQAGALAQIFINPDNQLHNMTVTTVWGAPTPETRHRIPNNPIVALKRPDGDGLRERLQSGEKIHVRVTGQVDTRWVPTELVVARIEGTDEPDKFVLVGGHLDSWHEGVTDNATGNAAMLEMARLLQQHRGKLRRSVRLAWWTGHSPGRYAGSSWYADHFYADLSRGAVAYVNVDSPGTRSGTLYRGTNMAELEDVNLAVIKAMTGQELERTGRPGKTADEAFVGIGVSSMRMSKAIPAGSSDRGTADGSGGSWWWHARTDSRDKADTNLLMKDVELLVAMVNRLASPAIIPYDYADTADEMLEKLHAIEKYDTSRLVAAVRSFRTRALRLTKVNESAVSDPIAWNTGLLRIGRALNSVYYSTSGPYDQDSNELIPRFPGIARAAELSELAPDSDDVRFLGVRLLREENRIMEGIQTAIDTADSLLAISD
ncbi:MAG: M28 family peptidase [Gammaproteobacteria bacterium]|nr:M28 family peptidase [Gammaproteobacteria bacterium]